MLTFDECERLILRSRSPSLGKPVCHNTRLYRDSDGQFRLYWNQTCIMAVYPGGFYHLYGDNQSTTIRKRLSAYSPVQVSQCDSQWCVTSGSWSVYTTSSTFDQLEIFPFRSGMAAHSDLRLTRAMLRLKGWVPSPPLPAGYTERWNDLCRPESFDLTGWLVLADWLEDNGARLAAEHIRAELPPDLVIGR